MRGKAISARQSRHGSADSPTRRWARVMPLIGGDDVLAEIEPLIKQPSVTRSEPASPSVQLSIGVASSSSTTIQPARAERCNLAGANTIGVGKFARRCSSASTSGARTTGRCAPAGELSGHPEDLSYLRRYSLLSIVSFARRWAPITLLGALAAGCSASGTSSANFPAGGPDAGRSVAQNRMLAQGRGTHSQNTRSQSKGWISPDRRHKKRAGLIYWGSYYNNTITFFASKGVNGKEKGQITDGLSNPERLFVDKQGSVYATNIGNNTITAYKRGQTSPFITISSGVNSPTGITVDAAGTIYCANVGNNTITVYPKGQTSPSLTIPYFAEYLATDAHDNLYAAGSAVEEFAPGSTSGTNLGLPPYPGALEVDRSGNLIVLYGSSVEYFPAGQTTPSKQITVDGSPFALSLSANEKQLYVSTEVSIPFVIESVAYPNGNAFTTKLTGDAGEWPIAVSPDNALGG